MGAGHTALRHKQSGGDQSGDQTANVAGLNEDQLAPPAGLEPATYGLQGCSFAGGGSVSAATCGDLLDPGEPFEHWCDLPAGHTGDHQCGDCGDVWTPSLAGDDWDEAHWDWHGTCPECVAMNA